jgi:hypothetical protein
MEKKYIAGLILKKASKQKAYKIKPRKKTKFDLKKKHE